MVTGENVPVRRRIRVEGIVQGVGFRSFVYTPAIRYGLAGLVGNDARGVFIEVEGSAGGVTTFQREVVSQAPPLAVVERVSVRPIPPTGARGFVVAPVHQLHQLWPPLHHHPAEPADRPNTRTPGWHGG
jgi:hydrogenase maturation factor HypF (carbamoyltransferase family)